MVIGLQDYWRQLSANSSIVTRRTANPTSCLRPVVGSASLLSATAIFWRLAILTAGCVEKVVLDRIILQESVLAHLMWVAASKGGKGNGSSGSSCSRVGEHVPDVLTPRHGTCFNS